MQNIYWLIAGLVLFELVTIPLYVQILYVLATNKEFNNPFFRLCLAMGIVELIHFASDFIFVRLPMIEGIADFYVGLPEGRWMALDFLTPFCVYAQFLFHFVISLTRFTAIWTPRQHNELWTKAWRYMIVLISAIAFGLSSDIFFSVGKYQYFDANDPSKGALQIFVRFDFYQFPYYFAVVVGTFTIIACLLINALVMGKIYYQKRKGGLKNDDKLEISMFIITLFMMIPQLVMSGAYLALVIFGATIIPFMFPQMLWINDMYSLSQPWALFFVCTRIRKIAFATIYQRQRAITSTTPVVNLQNVNQSRVRTQG